MDSPRVARVLAVGVITVSLGAITLYADDGDGNAQTASGPVPLQVIHDRGIRGQLGVRLGTLVEVEGEVIPNQQKVKDLAHIDSYLKISKVDGHLLEEPVQFVFQTANQWAEVSEPPVGERFHFVGYESGFYRGAVEGEFEYVQPYATYGFGFESCFFVLAENPKAE